jgi:hypothetical protein
MKKILVGSPIRQSAATLTLFLGSLENLFKDNLQVDYCFVDDNVEQQSKNILVNFQQKHSNVTLLKAEDTKEQYIKNENSHFWTDSLMDKVANSKNRIIQEMLDRGYDYLFFIDSDLFLQPETLLSLLKADKDIISEIFWTKWNLDSNEMPQVWLQDSYNMFRFARNETPTNEVASDRTLEFMQMLRSPGVYEVGGLGALTLIKRGVFESGVNFSNLYNVSFRGEDRHFCIRAVAHNFKLHVDTHYPAYHIYRESDLRRLLGV